MGTLDRSPASQAPPRLFLGDDDWRAPLPILGELTAQLMDRGYPRTEVMPLPGTIADACLDPVNAARALHGRSNLFQPSAAARLLVSAPGVRDHALVALQRLWLLGRPLEWARARRLLGARLAVGLLEAEVLQPAAGDAVRATIVVAPHGGRLFVADSFRLQDHPEYCYLGRSTFTVAEFLRAQGSRLRPAGEGGRLLDLACGAGAGAITCADGFSEVVGTDIVERCLRFARLNAALNGVEVDFHYSDVLSGVEGSFDMVIANTPCVWDDAEPAAPRTYAGGGSDFGLELPGRMIAGALERLRPGGAVLAIISAPVLGRRHYALDALERICANRPARVTLEPLLEEYELRNRQLYRRHGVSTIVRYLAVLRADTRFSATIGRGDRARLAAYRARTLPARVIGRLT